MAKYTVIIATHDRPALLARAIRTIKAQIFRDVKIIVVSDKRSTANHDVTRACLSGDDVYVERGGDPGPAQSRSYGLALADSGYVVFLDDDDEFSKEYLGTVDDYVKRTDEDGVFFCDFYVSYDGEDRTAGAVDPPLPVTIGDRDLQDVFVKNYIPNSCVIYPIDAVRGRFFDNSRVLTEDWDFLLNAIQGRTLSGRSIRNGLLRQLAVRTRGKLVCFGGISLQIEEL